MTLRDRRRFSRLTAPWSVLALVDSGGAAPVNRADNSRTTYEAAGHDYPLPYRRAATKPPGATTP